MEKTDSAISSRSGRRNVDDKTNVRRQRKTKKHQKKYAAIIERCLGTLWSDKAMLQPCDSLHCRHRSWASP